MGENSNIIKFYDTNALLNLYDKLGDLGYFYISSLVLSELENIKTSKSKTEDLRFKARKVSNYLREHAEDYECIIVKKKHHDLLNDLELDEDNDNLIIACAAVLQYDYIDVHKKVIFVTNDTCCMNIAKKIFQLNVETINKDENDNYKGYVEVSSDEEVADIYSDLSKNKLNLLVNEYLIVKDKNNQVVDKLKWNGQKLEKVLYKTVESDMLGKIRPLDDYQICVLDSLLNNQLTMIKGKAGSGKSYLALGYLFHQLEKNKIDKIIIFANPVATRNSARLGFYPGTKDDKLLDSEIGNFLTSKLGGRDIVDSLINDGKLLLLPMSDVRGFDTGGMKAGIYITEAQNMSIDLMRLALQRISEDCPTAIIDGDYNTQVDDASYGGSNNGMRRMSKIFKGHGLYGEIELDIIHRSEIARIADLM